MNQPIFPPQTTHSVVPADAIQIQAFAALGEMNFRHLNDTLGLTLSVPQYRRLQSVFFGQEKKNPSMGELRLLDRMIQRIPLSAQSAPGEIFTDSDALMETWADAMDGYLRVFGSTDTPCTLRDILALPEVYRRRLHDDHPALRIVANDGALSALSEGYEPVARLQAVGGAPRQLWQKVHSKKETPRASADDILLVLPPAPLEAVSVFLREHPSADKIVSLRAVSHTSVTAAALALCRGCGLSVSLDTLTPAVPPGESRIKAYLEAWETDAPIGSAYVLLRIPAKAQSEVVTALSDHGFSPSLLGQLQKRPVFTITDGSAVTVQLSLTSLEQASVKLFRSSLRSPQPLGDSLGGALTRTSLQRPSDGSVTVADATLPLEGGDTDGYTPAVRAVLSLCCDFAAAGIRYDHLSLSPVLYMDGSPEAPLLTSAVCGLYRAATELGIPLTAPEILFKRTNLPSEKISLVLSLMAYTEDAPCPTRKALTAADRPLSLLALDEDPRWEDIRGLLFTVASAVRSGEITAHSLDGQSVLSTLSRLASPEVALTAGLYEEHRALVSRPVPVGFLTEGTTPQGGLSVGLTRPRAEEEPLPPPCPPAPDGLTVTPFPSVTLQALNDQETQRRKETTAMEKLKAFEPLCKTPRTVLLDTDIGPDCDDVGALAVLIYYAKQYGFPIGGICNCTSNKAGNGVIDAVCRRCGMETPPLGQWSGEGFMDGQEHCKYNVAVAEAHSEAYRNGTLAVDNEVTYYRKRLSEAKEGDVMIVSIGMFNNLAALLDSPADEISPLSGMELVKAKVYALVSMAAILPRGRECNVVSDYRSCEKVFTRWPTPIYLSDFHIGVNVKTGYPHVTDPEAIMADPLPMSYHLYTKEWNWEGAVKGLNASYDLTAVQFAALGIGELYDLDIPGDLEFYAEIPDLPDATRFVANPLGNKIFMTKKVSDEVIADSLQKILNSF